MVRGCGGCGCGCLLLVMPRVLSRNSVGYPTSTTNTTVSTAMYCCRGSGGGFPAEIKRDVRVQHVASRGGTAGMVVSLRGGGGGEDVGVATRCEQPHMQARLHLGHGCRCRRR